MQFLLLFGKNIYLFLLFCCFTVYTMIKSASECSGREVEDHVTFGEFCVFASFLKDNYNHEG